MNVDWASLVEQLRSARGFTQEDFARELDVTVGTMSGWENGKHRPVKAQRKRLLKMAEELGINPPTLSPAQVGSKTGDWEGGQ
jgi:transcriptional regulator with XRE-family HTH domain